MNRSDFQQLAELRLREARVLIDQGFFDGAYYLLGYTIECAFKACIARRTREFDFPPNRRTVEAIYKHKAIDLLKASGLEPQYLEDVEKNKSLEDNWKIVQDWSEDSRYTTGRSEKEATDFYSAVISDEGVFTWLKKFW